MHIDPIIKELHVYPTYAVLSTQRRGFARKRSLAHRLNEINLRDNRTKGELSKKSQRKLSNAVNWLIASSKKQYVYDKQTDKRYAFRVNFITLTLPTTDHNISDHYFKSVMLHAFINAARYKFGLKNYVWKVETQANGNIHAHFTTDSFMHWQALRDCWNRILAKNGLLEVYQNKHKSLSFNNYLELYPPSKSRTIKQIRKAFDFGVSTNWSSPNTTDVHAVFKVNDLAGYIAKYLSKNDDDRRLIKGRLWSCSTNLSHKNKLSMELLSNADYEAIGDLLKPEVSFKEIFQKTALGVSRHPVAEVFFFKISDWGHILKGRLYDLYANHLAIIRNNLDVFSQDYNNLAAHKPPIPIPVTSVQTPTYRQLPLF